MKSKPLEIKEGWQMNVEIYEDYVIKYPKTRDQIVRSVLPYLKSVGKEEELEERTIKMLEDMTNSFKILKETKVPSEYLAGLVFLENGKMKQDKVQILDRIFENLKEKEEIKKIIDDYINFIILLWMYGIHENTYKFHSNFGMFGHKLVLIDPFEITNKKEKVLSQIERKKWAKHSRYGNNLSQDMKEYLIEKANRNWTEKKLNEVWMKNLK
jgi:hypothetical protein